MTREERRDELLRALSEAAEPLYHVIDHIGEVDCMKTLPGQAYAALCLILDIREWLMKDEEE